MKSVNEVGKRRKSCSTIQRQANTLREENKTLERNFVSVGANFDNNSPFDFPSDRWIIFSWSMERLRL